MGFSRERTNRVLLQFGYNANKLDNRDDNRDAKLLLLVAVLILGFYLNYQFWGIISKTALKVLQPLWAEFINQVGILVRLLSAFVF